jgi:hypothetical protein
VQGADGATDVEDHRPAVDVRDRLQWPVLVLVLVRMVVLGHHTGATDSGSTS